MLMHEPRLFFVLFCRQIFFHIFWSRLFFEKNTIANHFFSPYRDGKGCRETCIYTVAAFRFVIRIRLERKSRGAVFAGRPQKGNGWGKSSHLMEMVKITQKKMIWKRRIEEKNSWQRKRAKIKIEKMVGPICEKCYPRLLFGIFAYRYSNFRVNWKDEEFYEFHVEIRFESRILNFYPWDVLGVKILSLMKFFRNEKKRENGKTDFFSSLLSLYTFFR